MVSLSSPPYRVSFPARPSISRRAAEAAGGRCLLATVNLSSPEEDVVEQFLVAVLVAGGPSTSMIETSKVLGLELDDATREFLVALEKPSTGRSIGEE